jgi:hypothetical protein
MDSKKVASKPTICIPLLIVVSTMHFFLLSDQLLPYKLKKNNYLPVVIIIILQNKLVESQSEQIL